ncbi:MAG: DDE-type integrase/transposase/recombinase, partial [Actinomycetia bacterium]|nr:DDE-type integrase/transposase/recombinase [Actinomycetes bacterium]
AGVWRYVYRAVDQHGQVIDIYVSKRRNTAAATHFFETALAGHGRPTEVTTDLAAPLLRVVAELIPEAAHDTGQYSTDVIVNRSMPVAVVASGRPSPRRRVLVVRQTLARDAGTRGRCSCRRHPVSRSGLGARLRVRGCVASGR